MAQKNIIGNLMPIILLYPWTIPVITILGILSSLSEGLSITLFIPLLESVGQSNLSVTEGNVYINLLVRAFSGIPTQNRFLIIAVFIFIFTLFKTILTYSNSILVSWFNSRINHWLRIRIFKQLLSVSYSFIEASESGKLIHTFASETWRTSRALAVLIDIIINLCTIGVFLVLLVLISWKLTLLVTISMVVISAITRLVTRQVKVLGAQAVEVNAILSQRMWEGLGAMRLIRTFGREVYEQERFDRQSEDVSHVFLKLDVLSSVVNPLFEMLTASLLVCILVLAFQTQIPLPTVLTFIFLLYRLQPKIKQLDGARVSLLSLEGSVEEVMSLLNNSDKPYIRKGNQKYQGLRQEIAFESVSFSYNETDKAALKHVSLTIPQGKTTALVGPSGAGKSTLISLLCRLQEPTNGEIYVDGHPLWQLDLDAWRDRLAIVSQDIYMFATSVRENIAYGRLDATDDEIIAASELANAHDFILELPAGYETKIGDRGVRLSGGQRQRIALARAIVRNPEILILDEATNALDSIAENLIQEALNTLSQGRTVIIIAHRLSTIEQADQIIVLNNGQVVEQGTMPNLLSRNGLFAEMYSLQHRNAQV